jgi:hypothetical protein
MRPETVTAPIFSYDSLRFEFTRADLIFLAEVVTLAVYGVLPSA